MQKTLVVLAATAALVLAGCGGGGEETTAGTSTGGASRGEATKPAAQGGKGAAQRGGSKQGGDSSSQGGEPKGGEGGAPAPSGPAPTTSGSLPNEGSKAPAPGVPTNKGGDNSIQTFGVESASADRAEAALALQAYLDARAAGDWAGACSYLSGGTQELLEKLAERAPKLKGAGCAEVMAALTEGVPQGALAAEARIEVISFRVEGDSAFLVYRNPGGRISAIPMAQENGAWKVAGMGATPLGI
jgi:hypothetical protein